MDTRGKENIAETLKKGCLAPEMLRLKKGARVMLVKNNHEEKYANGTLGVVEECDGYGISVALNDGRTIAVKPTNWKIEEDGKTKAEIIQYPLRLAWAITVHKSQGMSLDCAEVDLSQSFEKGMGYVALSRIRSLDGLSLKGINEQALAINEEVFEFDKELRAKSKSDAEDLREEPRGHIEEIQKTFLAKIAPTKIAKAKKVETTEETKRLLLEGKSLSSIARERELKEGTIIDHLEKLVIEDPKLDLTSIREDIPKKRLAEIMDALKKGGKEGGVYRLTPAKIILGSDFSFEEIRIARLFM